MLELSHPPSKKKTTGKFELKFGMEIKKNARNPGKKESCHLKL
jgi:hypothetical protein